MSLRYASSTAICTNGDVRLVDGFTDREGGRVEVCMNGRWGTVCNRNPPPAGAICSQLGFPNLGKKICVTAYIRHY